MWSKTDWLIVPHCVTCCAYDKISPFPSPIVMVINGEGGTYLRYKITVDVFPIHNNDMHNYVYYESL